LASLSPELRLRAREAYKTFVVNPAHPGLRFKKVHPKEAVYSVRISRDVRALGVKEGDDIVWFWIGSHTEYDRLLTQL
jgi:hypothetical protein